MLVVPYAFKLAVIENKEQARLVRQATGETVPRTDYLQPDDQLLGTGEGSLYRNTDDGQSYPIFGVRSVAQLADRFSEKVLVARLLALTFWLVTGALIAIQTMRFIRVGSYGWTDFCLLSLFGAGSLLFTPQAVNPVLHDMTGKWVNLRTGLSNLNGGCVLK